MPQNHPKLLFKVAKYDVATQLETSFNHNCIPMSQQFLEGKLWPLFENRHSTKYTKISQIASKSRIMTNFPDFFCDLGSIAKKATIFLSIFQKFSEDDTS